MHLIFRSSVGALALAASISGALAADLGARKPVVASAANSPWEFQLFFGPSVYAVHNPYGKGVGLNEVYTHTGLGAELTAAYRLNSWFAPIVGVRGFASLNGSGKTLDASDAFFTDITKTRSSRMNAFGLTAGMQIGSGSFRVTPYGFVDFANMKTNYTNSFAVKPAAPTDFRYSEKLSTPIMGAGLRAQFDIYENFGLALDGWAGTLTKKHVNVTTFGAQRGYQLAAGARLSLTARY